MIRYATAALAALLTLLVCPAPADDAPDHQTRTLRGMTGVYVIVESLTPPLEAADLSTDGLRATVVACLERAGIRVLTRSEWLAEPGKQYLYANVTAVPIQQGDRVIGRAYDVALELNQSVTLDRDHSWVASATTWQTSMTGVASENAVKIRVEETIQEVTAKFCAAFFAVNPKRTGAAPQVTPARPGRMASGPAQRAASVTVATGHAAVALARGTAADSVAPR